MAFPQISIPVDLQLYIYQDLRQSQGRSYRYLAMDAGELLWMSCLKFDLSVFCLMLLITLYVMDLFGQSYPYAL